MKHCFGIGLVGAAFLLSPPAAAMPADIGSFDLLDEARPLEPALLADQRGGFSWNGMEIRLGADIRTYINGELALQMIVNWSADGASRQDTIFGSLTPVGADTLRAGVLSTGTITMNVGNNAVYLANGGQTALVHRTDSGVQSILVNTASNTTLRQQVDATLDITNFTPFAREAMALRLGNAAGDEIARLTAGGL